MFLFISKLTSLLTHHLSQHLSQEKPSLWEMCLSVLAGIFGVQSEKNHQRDFNKGSAWSFAFLGLIALLFFIIAVILLTRWALSLAGV